MVAGGPLRHSHHSQRLLRQFLQHLLERLLAPEFAEARVAVQVRNCDPLAGGIERVRSRSERALVDPE